MKNVFIFCILLIPCFYAIAQKEPVKVTRDTIYIESQDTMLIRTYAKRYNPRKSLLLATLAPGAGQVYNKKYWKLPLVYGGFCLIGTGIGHYNNIFKQYKAHIYYNLEHNLGSPNGVNPTTQLTTERLRIISDRAQRNRDFMVILMAGMYLLQVIDAHVDTHLKEFDLNPSLKKARKAPQVQATVTQDIVLGRQTGVSMVYKF